MTFKIFFLLYCVIVLANLISSTPIWDQIVRAYEPKTNVFDLTIKKVGLAPDGFSRILSTINGQYPGPTIEVNKGDRVIINVHNELGEPTGKLRDICLCFYIIYVKVRFDGAIGQTQCGIPDNYIFTYDYTVSDQFGTYWYHSHATTQYVDGIVGALIIHDPDDPYITEYDEEIIVMLTDYHRKFYWNLSLLLQPVPDNGLINGKNNFNCSQAPPGSTCVDNAGLAKFVFIPKKMHFRRFFFSIDKHEMEVIEVEGSYTKRNKIHRLPINVAQRYSVIVTANQPVDNYVMRSEFQKTCMPDEASKLPVITAIVHYDGAPEDSAPKDAPWKDFLEECIDLDHKTLQPLYEEKVPEATKEMELVIAFHNDSLGIVKAFLNESTYVPDIYSPSLLKAFAGQIYDLPPARNAFILDNFGEVVDISFINTDEGEHPFHIHGHQFWVLGTGNGTIVDKDALNKVNPIKRDTSTIPAKGWMVFRFVADNPGVFGIHCHMKWHLQSGLLMQLIEFPEEIKKMNPPQEWARLCDLT
ncbi:Cupredoxin [Rhizophagus irregularis]|uniref:Cupredoxin n=1 Tax=Rhizophagus irregularis TaxID=588596 RepID=A0A2I1H7W6_9GLOM|nr:Cupredoxin [Rhizophagus irregularis]